MKLRRNSNGAVSSPYASLPEITGTHWQTALLRVTDAPGWVLVTMRWPGAEMAPMSRISPCR
jgi:hypothetical protein